MAVSDPGLLINILVRKSHTFVARSKHLINIFNETKYLYYGKMFCLYPETLQYDHNDCCM